MSYAAPFSLLSWHLPDHGESVAERLRWPLAGSAFLHAVVFVAVLSLRFGSSLEQSSGSYEVTLVTLPEIAAPPTAAPQRKAVIPPSKGVRTTSRPQVKARVPDRAVDALVSVPKPQTTAIPKVVTPPVSADPRPILKQNVDRPPPSSREDVRDVPKPERVTESLVSALDAVIVPKPQTLSLPQESAPVRPSVPAPVKQSPAVEKDMPAFKAPPQPPQLVVRKPAEPPTPAPSGDLLAPKLKQAVGATSVPKKPEQVSKRVSAAVASKRQQKQSAPKAPEAPAITLPSRAPRLAAVALPEMRKKETPLQTERQSSTVESFKEAIQSVRIPQRNPKSKTVSPKKAVPLVSETVSPAKASEARNQSLPKIVPPQAPRLAEVQDPVPSEPSVSEPASEPDTPLKQEIDVSIPDLLTFDPQPVSEQPESGGAKARGLWKVGLCSPNNPYWENVEAKIDNIHRSLYRYHYRVESPAILTFHVKRNGQVTDLDVVQSSGNEKFDLVAKRAVLEAAPLPPFPANMTKPFCLVQHNFRVKPNR
ncbi:MAG: TonB family protein [Nitrospira sp. SB0662_bin_26]|nr:TonB family protein [Nitrospira sp. SB0662_bin_26]